MYAYLPPSHAHRLAFACHQCFALLQPCSSPSLPPGAVQVRRAKQGSTALRLRGGTAGGAARNYFWRLAIDTCTWRVVTDLPAAVYVDVG